MCWNMSSMSTEFQYWIITHGPPDWELEKKNHCVSFHNLFCNCFLFARNSLFFSVYYKLHSTYMLACPYTCLNCMNIGLYHPLWFLFPLFTLVVWLSVYLSISLSISVVQQLPCGLCLTICRSNSLLARLFMFLSDFLSDYLHFTSSLGLF